jgi:hypothetical protein
MTGDELLEQLQAYALSSRNPRIDVRSFFRTLPRDLLTFQNVEEQVRELGFKGALAMEQEEGKPLVVTLPDLPTIALIDEYRRIAQEPERPFPREETAPLPIPPGDVVVMEAEGRLGVLFDELQTGLAPIVKMVFPDDVPSLVVPRACARTELVDAAVARINRYLQGNRNGAYIESKLGTLLRGSEGPVRQALEDITLRPRKAAATILQPTEIAFRFWNHLAKVVIQDTTRKPERTALDTALLQSSHVLAWAVFHHKGVAQREQERAVDRKALELLVRKPPFVFEHRDLYELRDENGVTFSSKHSREFIHEFIRELQQKKDDSGLPAMLRFRHPTGKDYFAHRDFIIPVFLNLLSETGEALRLDYVKEWLEEMRRDRTPPASQSDELFTRDLQARVSAQYPVLSVLSNGPVLNALLQAPGLDAGTAEELSRCFVAGGRLKSTARLLGLSRQRLWKEVLTYLPVWQSVPFLRAIARAFRKLLRGRESAAPSATAANSSARLNGADPHPGATERQQLQRFQARLRSLLNACIPEGRTEAAALEELIERWNPLLEPGPKEDLVHDVNALVQDFTRPVRRSLTAQLPDLPRIQALAEKLAASRSLSQIANKDALLRYLELYMLRCLLTPERTTARGGAA